MKGLIELLKVIGSQEVMKGVSHGNSARVRVSGVDKRAVVGVFSEVEVPTDKRVGGERKRRDGVKLIQPERVGGSIEIAVHKVKLLTRSLASEGREKDRAVMNNSGGRGRKEGRGGSREELSRDNGEDTTPGGVRRREMDGMGGKGDPERLSILIRGSTDVLKAHHPISVNQREDMRGDLSRAAREPSRGSEASRVDIVENDRRETRKGRNGVVRKAMADQVFLVEERIETGLGPNHFWIS